MCFDSVLVVEGAKGFNWGGGFSMAVVMRQSEGASHRPQNLVSNGRAPYASATLDVTERRAERGGAEAQLALGMEVNSTTTIASVYPVKQPLTTQWSFLGSSYAPTGEVLNVLNEEVRTGSIGPGVFPPLPSPSQGNRPTCSVWRSGWPEKTPRPPAQILCAFLPHTCAQAT